MSYREIYRIDPQKLNFPREVFTTETDMLLGRLSPSRVWMLKAGAYGQAANDQYHDAITELVRMKVNERTCTRAQWYELRRKERLTAAQDALINGLYIPTAQEVVIQMVQGFCEGIREVFRAAADAFSRFSADFREAQRNQHQDNKKENDNGRI